MEYWRFRHTKLMNRALSTFLVFLSLWGNRGLLQASAEELVSVQEERVMLYNLQILARQARLESRFDPDFIIADGSSYIRSVMSLKDGRDPARDYWGTEIQVIGTGKSFYFTSAGPDKIFGTQDDLKTFTGS